MNQNDKSKETWYIASYSNIFLLLSGEEAGTLASYKKFLVQI